MTADIVSIELSLTGGDFNTLYAPPWRENDEDWTAALGSGDDLYGFGSVAELVAFIRNDDDNDLADHPSYSALQDLPAPAFRPTSANRYDVIGVLELASDDPTADVVRDLSRTLDMVRILGEICDISIINRFFSGTFELAALGGGAAQFAGREGEQLWLRIGAALARSWDDIIDALDSILVTPATDPAAVEDAEAELLIAEALEDGDTDDASDEDFELVDLDTDDAPAADSADEVVEEDIAVVDASGSMTAVSVQLPAAAVFWDTVGIDPIKIILTGVEYYTLRTYLNDRPVFLGEGNVIYVFVSERALARYLADHHDHALARVSTYEDVAVAATDGSLRVHVLDENVYVLPGIADDLAAGPDEVDTEQLELAVELLTDAADFVGDDSVGVALAPATPLGRYVHTLLDRTGTLPSPPFTEEASAWRELENEFEVRLERPRGY